MAVELFTTSSLSRIDAGRIAAAFEGEIKRAEADCKDRPATPKPRKVELHVSIEPIVAEDGSLESCDVTFRIKSSIPSRESKTYNMRAGRHGLSFNELSPEDIHQGTLDDAQSGTGPRKAVKA